MAEFTLDEDQQQIQDMMRKFAENEFRGIARDCDEASELPASLQSVSVVGIRNGQQADLDRREPYR